MVNSTVFLGGVPPPNESWVRGVERSLIECLYIQTHTYIPHKHTVCQARIHTLTRIYCTETVKTMERETRWSSTKVFTKHKFFLFLSLVPYHFRDKFCF